MNEFKLGPVISKYGLLLGLISSVVYLATTITGMAMGGSTSFSVLIGIFSLVISVVFVVLGIKNQRDEVQGGYITLAQCVLAGTGILVLSGLISTIVSLLYTNFIDPGYMDRLLAATEEKWAEAGLSDEQIEDARGWMMATKKPLLVSAVTLVCYGVGGAIISLIVGLIMKKEKPEFS